MELHSPFVGYSDRSSPNRRFTRRVLLFDSSAIPSNVLDQLEDRLSLHLRNKRRLVATLYELLETPHG
jgi:hypothetical protein